MYTAVSVVEHDLLFAPVQDGDVPHPAIGMARRMQVPDADKQHMVMVGRRQERAGRP
jgi:stage III sporulation protein SpoIIIAA